MGEKYRSAVHWRAQEKSVTLVGKSYVCLEQVGVKQKKKKKSGSPRASRDMRRRVCAICPVLRCIAGRAAINAREVLILLIKV